MAKTRLGYGGYGVQRAGSFAGKVAQSTPITRLSLDGYGARRARTFAGKTSTVESPKSASDWITLKRRRRH